ncbi:family 43 glycosylhydrolase [Cellvibrio japonicus]|uniref:Beta-xylosidase/alpha-L-arabinfuranosidase, putative, gly43H n=1 Tax=Cellvibrio japonicus (strain Ueda107) TaxID=498211 RepID=B3PD49_CELJU|nr:family 43 glycosylhydrolase [Cellvibrio japonicus]ACE86140.1 beta-xylosidase/alpha-L-arabinfuranosidase, putative, gly43H [Cellvibrio japonicus Ueda107]QEI13315.1 family 43 glycosylhydrolase [Cellvibrio japonicus]QEI16889.1 family 43 glycosylhydrolase [Cellvibrio japonicus]QEI20467.1 family 43 glycosylhydrolase [Cellvibrio japonicus]
MLDATRRGLFKACVAGAVASPFALAAAQATLVGACTRAPLWRWGQGIEGQRTADLGDGTFLNPIVPGDHPDPTILKDGEDYYMTFSSFNSYPGIVLWHSTDLVNWAPVGAALQKNIGTVWALDLCKHNNRYYIYIPAAAEGKPWSIYVIWADDIRGPWSDPIDLHIEGCIDPGHAVGEDGKRYLFVNGIRKIRLTDDGLATEGELEHAYSPWRYPDHWIVENFAPEGPKLMRRGEWFYLVTAVGGTAGPVTGHMVIAARARSIHGPWEHCPHNPLVRTLSEAEPWWSRGHATLVEGPKGDWWMVYHAYENGFRTLGRQTLLEPIEWTDDGWFRARGGDLSLPMAKPGQGKAGPAGMALSDDFSRNRLGIHWSFHQPRAQEMSRVKYLEKALVLSGTGHSPADSSPLTCTAVDRAYRVELSLSLSGDAEAGLLLFYNHKAYVGIGFNGSFIKTHQYAEEHPWARVPLKNRNLRIRLTNDRHVITYEYSRDNGRSWQLHPTRMEVSGLHHNVFGGFLSLKPAIYCVGSGQVQLRDFRYQALVSPGQFQARSST